MEHSSNFKKKKLYDTICCNVDGPRGDLTKYLNIECQLLSCIRLFATHQAPLSIRLSRQKYRSGFPFPSPKDLPDPEIEPRSPTLQTDSLLSEPPGSPC